MDGDRWQRVSRWWRGHPRWFRETAFGALFVVAAAADAALDGPPSPVRVAAVVLAPLPLPLRHRYPRTALAVAAVALTAAALLGLPAGVETTVMAVVIVSVVLGDPGLRPLPVFAVAALPVIITTVGEARRTGRGVDPDAFVFGLVGTALAVSVGTLLRRHRAALAELAARNAELERLRAAEAQRAVQAERVRIARELHDVVAHHVSAMVVRSRAAAHLHDRVPAETPAALAYVADTGAQTLRALRSMVGVLRAGEPGPAPLAPQPRLAELPDLVTRSRDAGQAVTLRERGTPRELGEDAEVTVYRVVQEGLANALRHAPGAPVAVELRWDAARLTVDVANGPVPAGTPVPRGEPGHGLVGMRERLALGGGRLRAGPDRDGGWTVSATLPFAGVPPFGGTPPPPATLPLGAP